MRMPSLLALTLGFLPALGSPARADTIDDFHVTAPGLDLAFSHSSRYTFPDQPALSPLPPLALSASINGVSDSHLLATFFPDDTTARSVTFDFPAELKLDELRLYGPVLFTEDPQASASGGFVNSAIFQPGTYFMIKVSFDPSPLYTFTITPETSSAPEPTPILLLLTGSLALLVGHRYLVRT